MLGVMSKKVGLSPRAVLTAKLLREKIRLSDDDTHNSVPKMAAKLGQEYTTFNMRMTGKAELHMEQLFTICDELGIDPFEFLSDVGRTLKETRR